MVNKIKLKRGLDIAINGRAAESVGTTAVTDVYAVIPDHFAGITPKVVVKEGDRVKAGTPLFHDKSFTDMNFVAPVSGEIAGINRGDRRKVLSITIKADAQTTYEQIEVPELSTLSGADVKALLLQAGLWGYIKQRPYDIVARPDKAPKAIFISSFDSAPLAADFGYTLKGRLADLQAGIDALAKMTDGKVYVGLKANSKANDFGNLKNAVLTEFDGPHPAGNVGVQINHISPVNKGEVVWTVNMPDVAIIGHLFTQKTVDMAKIVALTGPTVREPQYYKYIYGAPISSIAKGNVYAELPLRYIAGNVLSGTQISIDEPLPPYANQLTVIDDGSETHELLGWAMPRLHKFSASRTFCTQLIQKLMPKTAFEYDARLLGGRRAIIMSGEYDRLLPMDIYTEYLIKAMIAGNLDKMEQLGAYEIAPEDVALCEFACTSKMPLQAIVRQALDNMRKELE